MEYKKMTEKLNMENKIESDDLSSKKEYRIYNQLIKTFTSIIDDEKIEEREEQLKKNIKMI